MWLHRYSFVCQGHLQCIQLYGHAQPGCTSILYTRGSSDSSDMPRASRERERSFWNWVVSHSVDFHRMWGETRIVYSCFLPDTEGGRWRAKEGERERGREGGRESSPLCDVHWCSWSSRSNAASVLCSSSSRLPSAPLNYSQPEVCDVAASFFPLSSSSLDSSVLLFSVSLSFFLMWQLVSKSPPPQPVPHPLIYHHPPIFY